MSEPKMISPLLDHYLMGQPISDHDGVRCCPAVTKIGGNKYIVKIISIPASQVQLEGLLLAGAYNNKYAALSYYKDLADGVAAEAEILKNLSRFEGFVPYEDLQIVEMDEGRIGYEVYLLSPYKRCLERHMRKHPLTQLQAVNLGLDLCASMVMCRRAGYLYVDLKPGNIFMNEKNEYCVGDLGFVRLDALKYANLPDKYRSAYTAPELEDVLNPLNETVDTYAIGLILYQIYNDGALPESGTQAPPAYADPEIAEIIMKAIAADPDQRWKDPMEMGQALVAYMQSNSVNDVPIIPIPEEPAPEEPAPEEGPVTDEEPIEEIQAEPGDLEPETPAEPSEPEPEVSDEPEAEDPASPEISAAPAVAEAPVEQMVDDVAYEELSEDASDILAQADELIAMEPPAPVIPPEPIDVPIPEPIMLSDDTPEEPAEEDPDAEEENPSDPEQAEPIVAEPENPESEIIPADAEDKDEEKPADPPAPEKRKGPLGMIAIILAILLLFGAAAYGYHYYQTEYLQTISKLEILGQQNNLTVQLTSDIDDGLLTVTCTDSYGNVIPSPVENGVARFDNLNPDTIYKVSVSIDGFHELRGQTTATYTTPTQTSIVQFNATAGTAYGSVVLTFTVEGPDSNSWTVFYSTEGEVEKSETFSGHVLTLNDLTPGKEYTFRLAGTEDMYLVGSNTLSFTIESPVLAENLAITKCTTDGITAVWTAPAGVDGMTWVVRCYSDGGFDQTIETTDLTATFTEINPSEAFTVEVTGKGMSTGVMTHISARSATITESVADTSKPLTLTVSWSFDGDTPQGGWLVTYGAEGTGKEETLLVADPTISIYPAMSGDTYHFTVNAADGITVFENTFSHETGAIQLFSGYGVTSDDMSFRMCNTPSYSDWSWYDLESWDYTSTFESGANMSLVLILDAEYDISDDYIDVLFVIRNEDRDIICTSSTGASWTYLWDDGHCELDVPTIPTESGRYSIDIYFNGMAVARDFFSIE